MSSTQRHRRRRQGRSAWAQRWRWLLRMRIAVLGAAAIAALAAFVIVLAATSNASRQAQQSAQRSAQSPSQPNPHWVPVASTAPADVLQAAQTTDIYQEVAGAQPSRVGQALRNGTLGSPVLVKVYRPAPGQFDVWVVPVLQRGQVTALLDFAYDAANKRLYALSFSGPFAPGDPAYGQPFPRLSADRALAALSAAKGAAATRNAHAELVYFPADAARLADPRTGVLWNGGGQFPDLAIWRVPAADGHDNFVGVDGAVYSAAQLPLAPNASP